MRQGWIKCFENNGDANGLECISSYRKSYLDTIGHLVDQEDQSRDYIWFNFGNFAFRVKASVGANFE